MPKSYEGQWRAILTGEMRGLAQIRRLFSFLPSSPRCKLCNAPFGAPGRFLLRLTGYRQSAVNRRLCNVCMRGASREPGGAEVETTVLFLDVRGSTTLAETKSAASYSQAIARLYGVFARAVDAHDGIVDKFIGDGAVALFVPGFAGEGHAAAAVRTARSLLREASSSGSLPVGIGVHTGPSFVGTVGEGDAFDFTALGDTVNVAARVTNLAGAGEALVTDEAAAAAKLDTAPLEHRALEIRGRSSRVGASVFSA